MIVFPNTVMAVCAWIRDQLPALSAGKPWDVPLVTNRWNDTDLRSTRWAVIVRNDGGPDDSPVSQSVSLGITCFGPRGGSESEDVACERLAQAVAAIIRDCAQVGLVNPFAACTDLNGPYPVPSETGRPAYYLTATVTVVGQPV